MAENPDPPIRKTVALPSSLWQQVEDYQFANRIKKDAEAIRRLVQLGLESITTERKTD
ncbi:MAG: hypothetical protein ABF876_05175 [Acetobacter aceti]